MAEGSRLRRFVGLVGVGARSAVARLVGGRSRRVLVTVVGVAVAVGFTLAVTGVALGLASGATVGGEDVDYWIVPDDGSSTMTVASDGLRLGDSHATALSIADDSRVDHASPVLLEFVGLENPSAGVGEYVLVVGVVPSDEPFEVAGVSTGELTAGDPRYANGSYGGDPTNEVVLSESAAGLLNASEGTDLRLRTRDVRTQRVAVEDVDGASSAGVGSVPIAVVHLAELQSVTGTTEGDHANQILVITNDPSVRGDLEGVYPETNVIARDGVGLDRSGEDELPLAVVVAAFVTAVGVGALTVATMMGLEVTNDRRRLALLAAVGYTRRSRALVVLVEVLTVALLGGLLGVCLGAAGIEGTNRIAASVVGDAPPARFSPVLVPYGIGLAIVIGVVASLYPVYLSYRTRPMEVITR
ncbi:FtsX-like permease family protein [Halostella pelagica]|uniref:FtsX-like permease family protein n=1 Tax=Halostella pelagica TaxID=2583824 RepID=UPI001080054F|nr:FtsX-like permease family protein [Halostella pelagica]